MPGFRVIASALDERNLCLAQIAAVQLRVPDLPDMFARRSMEAEDLLIKRARDDERLARNGWDPAEHPRAGVPPSPAWFADKPTQMAQGEEDERAPEEMLDPLAPVRQWDARTAVLRQIDPGNPNLTYFSDPNSAPSQAALDRLNAALEAAAIKRVTDTIMPGGVLIGKPGRAPYVQILPGGLDAAIDMFDYLRVGGEVVDKPGLEGTLVKLPGDVGFITFRAISTSGPPAVDVNVRSMPFTRLHFIGRQ